MRETILECVQNAQANGETFRGWTFEEVAADILDKTDLDYPLNDIARELVSLNIAGEIDFA